MKIAMVNGVRLAFEVHGDAGEPVLFLGGTGMPGSFWLYMGQVPALLAAGFRPVTFDGRGVGASEGTAGPYTVPQLAEDAAGLIRALDLGPTHLVGVSQGGFIAEHLASTCPELLSTVTLIASAGPTTAYTRAWAQCWRDLLATGCPIPDSVYVSDILATGLPQTMLQDDDVTVQHWVSLFSAATGWTNPGMLGQQAACHAWLLDHDHQAAWPAVTVPCLVMAFEHDLSFPPRVGRIAAGAMPAAEFLAIAGVGHANGLFDAAAEITAGLLDFLGRHRDGARPLAGEVDG